MPNRGPRIRLLVADDHPEFLAGVRAWLDGQPDLVLAGIVHCSEDLIPATQSLRPDLVLVDETLPTCGGFRAVQTLTRSAQAPPAVIVSFFDSQATRKEAWAAGAAGFLAKADFCDRLPALAAEMVATTSRSRRKKRSAAASPGVPPDMFRSASAHGRGDRAPTAAGPTAPAGERETTDLSAGRSPAPRHGGQP